MLKKNAYLLMLCATLFLCAQCVATAGITETTSVTSFAANVAPTLVSVTPASGSVAIGVWKTLTCTYSDDNGTPDLATCNLLVNTSIVNAGGAHFFYDRNTNKFYMRNNASEKIPLAGVLRGTATIIESENAILDCAATSVTTSGNNLIIAWRVKFKSPMIGKNCNLYMTATDNHFSTSGWIDKGDLNINAAPEVVSATPASGSVEVGVWKTLTCTYSDANGPTDLATCNLLVNTSIVNAGGAHFIYDRVTNKFYMRNNAGEKIPLGGVVRGTATVIQSENAILDCLSTTVTASGNNLIIAWRVKFKSPMMGKNCNLYMTAVDASTSTPGWVDKGDLSINAPPAVLSATPASGSVAVGVWKTLTCTYFDANGAADLATCNLLVNTSIVNAGGAHFFYDRIANKFYMRNNAGEKIPLTGVVRGTATIIESENAILDCAATTVTTSGNGLIIAWRVKFKSPMMGKNCNLYMTAVDASASTSGWIDKGDLSINASPTVVSATPASGSVAVGAWKTLTCIYSDANGATDLATCILLVNTSIVNAGGAHFIYDRVANKFYMKNNAGEKIPLTGVVRGTATTIESENAVLDCAATTVTTSGSSLIIAWRVQFKTSMQGKNCNLYMTAVDASASTSGWVDKGDVSIVAPTAGGLIELGKAEVNLVVMMEPFDATKAKTHTLLAKSYFEQALAAGPTDAQRAEANFGLAITDAALTAQTMIDKYKDQFASNGGAPASLKYAVGALQIMNLPSIAEHGKEPLGGLVTSYSDSIIQPYSTQNPDPQLLLDMQTDVKNVVRTMLSRVAGYLGIVEAYGGASFAFPIGTSAWENYTIVDIGDVYLFHGALLAARWVLAIPASYNVNIGTFNFDTPENVLDINHDGLLTPSEWLPPSPFLALTSSATMTGAKADMTTAADKIIAGINATLAETTDNYDLIKLHTPGEGTTQADLLEIRDYANDLKSSMNGPTAVTWTDNDDVTHTDRIFLGAWNTTPPTDLKVLSPTMELQRWRDNTAGQYHYGMEPAETGFPDITAGGIFPDGWSRFNVSKKIILSSGFPGTLTGVITDPANGATHVSTGRDYIAVSKIGHLPATFSVYLQRFFGGAWRGVTMWPGWNDGTTYYVYLDSDLWPNWSYRIIVTDEITHASTYRNFTTGADAPF